MRFFADASGQLAALRTNELHVLELSPQQLSSVNTNLYAIAHQWGVAPNSVAFNFLKSDLGRTRSHGRR